MIDQAFVYSPVLKVDENFRMLSVGGLIHRKNYENLINSFAKAFSMDDHVTLRIAGDGPLKEELEKLIHQLGRESQIILLGMCSREEVLKEYKKCNCFILLSKSETFGLVYREAMCVGRPVISSRNGGIEENWDDRDGILLDENTIDCAAKALKYIKYHCEDYDGKRISDRCRAHYSPDVIMEEQEKLFHKIIDSHK
jgi:glycosyltransferase involved in cell wall biosynthesis